MATNRASTTNGTQNGPEKSYYEQQREMLVTEIAQVSRYLPPIQTRLRFPALFRLPSLTPPQSLELVLQNINKLNRSLEEVTQVGNEFAPVESLWSHFENVMAKDPSEQQEGAQEGATEHEGETEVPQDRK